MFTSTATRDHEEIRHWAEARGALPSEVASTHNRNEPGILRFQFPRSRGQNDQNLREISWDAFFEKFDENDLELVYQEKTADGEKSNFNKLVRAEQSSPSSRSHVSAKGKDVDLEESSDELDEDEDEEDDDEEDEDEDTSDEDEPVKSDDE